MNKTEMIGVKVDKDLAQEIDDRRKPLGLTKAAYVRMLIMAALRDSDR